ncbi:ATP-binding protein [Leucobacter sp. wl10]|uniref:ATP-binding protein n=1 Tax=Leucobacter sp. wl10 TaxID=2304677 RepID=UPI001968E756|nr:ATP-binding protein [Leucobacter sp. wl10]
MEREMEIQELIQSLRERGGDRTEIEVKRAQGGAPRLGETLSAFGNLPEGGTIILGLDEGRGFAATGVENPAGISAGVASQARNDIRPPVQLTFEEVRFEGATLVVVTVAPLPLHQRPAYYRGVAYLRQADGDYRMSAEEEQQVYALRDRPRNDATPVPGSGVQDLDPGLLSRFLARVRASSRRLSDLDDETVMRRKGVTAATGGEITVAGLYALGAYPQQYLPGLSITAAVQHRTGRERGLGDLVHLDGPLPDLLEAALEWVRRNTRNDVYFESSGAAFDRTEIPMIAVRELIANALVHRDLSTHAQSKRVELRLKDDTLVISNPGGLYGVSADQLGHPEGKSAVNEFLYEICKSVQTSGGARVIEGEGGGIQEVQRALRRANMRPPIFIDRGIGFTVLVPRHALIEPGDLAWIAEQDPDGELTDVQRQLLATMRHGSVWTNALVRKRFAPIDSRQATRELQELVAKNLATTRGERGQTEYVIQPALAAPNGSKRGVTSISEMSSDVELVEDRTAVAGRRTSTRPRSVGLVVRPEDPGAWNEHAVLTALADVVDGLKMKELAESCGLTLKQARYAVGKLLDSGRVERLGGQGDRRTRYRLRESGGEVEY